MENPNKLTNLELYKKLQKKYYPSAASIDIFAKIKYFPLVGISSSGRDTLIKCLTKKYPIFFDLITTTTRKPRINNGTLERNGFEYNFISENDFFSKIKNGELIEWAVIHDQQLSGSDIMEVQKAVKLNKIIINDVTPAGVIRFQQYSNNVYPIFILPPNFNEWQRRMRARGTISEEELNNRLLSAKNEITECLKIKNIYFVVNDNLEETAEAIYHHILANIELKASVKLDSRKTFQSPGSARPVKTSFSSIDEAMASPPSDKNTFSSPKSNMQELQFLRKSSKKDQQARRVALEVLAELEKFLAEN